MVVLYHDAYKEVDPNETILDAQEKMVHDCLVAIMNNKEAQQAFADYLTQKCDAAKARSIED